MDQVTKVATQKDLFNFDYIKGGIKAEGHTPIYKFHKYFARRPHNVFQHIIQSYTRENDLVVDCFCGGGVTLVEGIRLGRRVVGIDTNPLAVFVSESQLTVVAKDEYKRIIEDIEREYSEILSSWYGTECRNCSSEAPVRWYEHAYLVNCPSCGEVTPLDNTSKIVKGSRVLHGHYTCNVCEAHYKAVDVTRESEKIISLRYRCRSCGDQSNAVPNESDINKKIEIEKNFKSIINKYELDIPEETIPKYWDRQQEDCLHRKGFTKFSDFFTQRNLLSAAILKKLVQRRKLILPSSHYRMLLFTFSATLRYLNNLNFSTDSWMGGRPVAWAKHAFWTPNQFVEVNPIEYLEKRKKAFLSLTKISEFQFRFFATGRETRRGFIKP